MAHIDLGAREGAIRPPTRRRFLLQAATVGAAAATAALQPPSPVHGAPARQVSSVEPPHLPVVVLLVPAGSPGLVLGPLMAFSPRFVQGVPEWQGELPMVTVQDGTVFCGCAASITQEQGCAHEAAARRLLGSQTAGSTLEIV